MALPKDWRVARAIIVFHAQLRPLAPNAPAVAFGTVADAAHGTTSDHYPKLFAGLGPRPTVTAGDIPKADRLDPRAVLDGIRRSRDGRVKYGISNGQMFSSYPAHGYAAWTWRPYSGSDGHFDHGHLSVVGDGRADQTHPWAIGGPAPSGGDMDPKGRDIHPELENRQVLRDLWDWAIGDRQPDQKTDGSRFRFPIPTAQLLAELRAIRADLTALRSATGTGVGGTLTREDVRQVVDEELDEQARGGADAD